MRWFLLSCWAWILVGDVWNLVVWVQNLVALQTVWWSIGTSVYSTTVQEGVWKFGERMYRVLNHLEPTWTSLNLSWNNACACEQLGNHFKFVGTDLWTIEPIGIYRNQVGTNLEPNGTSLCMEELGDGFSFVFVVFGVFGCCLTHILGTWCCELIW